MASSKPEESKHPIGVELPNDLLSKVKPKCCGCKEDANIFYSYKGKDEKWFCRPCLDKFIRKL